MIHIEYIITAAEIVKSFWPIMDVDVTNNFLSTVCYRDGEGITTICRNIMFSLQIKTHLYICIQLILVFEPLRIVIWT